MFQKQKDLKQDSESNAKEKTTVRSLLAGKSDLRNTSTSYIYVSEKNC